jgi:hypothetical protein
VHVEIWFEAISPRICIDEFITEKQRGYFQGIYWRQHAILLFAFLACNSLQEYVFPRFRYEVPKAGGVPGIQYTK